MKIGLCIKQVPDTTDIKWTENNTIQREGVESVINPFDLYAIEFALNIKSKIENSTITVFSMGPLQAKEMLRKAIALGCDDAVLISDKKFAAADTYATGLTISSAIKKVIPDFDLIVCGQFATDGDTAQTGPIIAHFLDIPQITYVKYLEHVTESEITVKQELENGLMTLKSKLPVLVCVTQNEVEPRRAKINSTINSYHKEISILSMEDIGLTTEQVGLKGSPTYVSKAFRNISSHNAQKFKLDLEQSVNLLKEKLAEFGVNNE